MWYTSYLRVFGFNNEDKALILKGKNEGLGAQTRVVLSPASRDLGALAHIAM